MGQVLIRNLDDAVNPAQTANAPGIAFAFVNLVPAQELVPRSLAIALEIGHPIYDCIFLALAEKLDCSVLTADRRFANSCRGPGYEVRLEQF